MKKIYIAILALVLALRYHIRTSWWGRSSSIVAVRLFAGVLHNLIPLLPAVRVSPENVALVVGGAIGDNFGGDFSRELVRKNGNLRQ